MNSSSLYIHIPFCSRKCLFCSFTIAVGQEHRRENYVDALMAEMQNYRGTPLETVYLGGGTPSLLEDKNIGILINTIKNNFILQNHAEITLEANPETIDERKAVFLRSQGFNRISLGVQSLNDRYLKFLGRNHHASKAREAFKILRETGFNNINVDLMYAFPGQTARELQEDVRAIADFGSEHLSLYTLTIEPNSRFHAVQMKLDDEETQAEHYLLISRLLAEYGFKQYEVSNFAKIGFESRHNSRYWQRFPYIGLGVGAHGFDGRRRFWNTDNFQDYLQKAAQGESTVAGFEDLTDEQLIMEKVLFGLRMNQGIAWELIPPPKQPQVKAWIKDGFLSLEKGNLKTTNRGRLVLDDLSSRLI